MVRPVHGPHRRFTSVRLRNADPGWVVVVACCFVTFGVWNANVGFGVFLPVLSHEFGWSRGAISLAASLQLIAGGTIAFAVGAASDRFGPRLVLALSSVVSGAAFLLTSAVGALWHFYLLQGVLLGIGMAGMYLVPMATVAHWFTEKRGLAFGIILAGLNLAFVTGAPLSAFLIAGFGWRTAFRVLGGLVWVLTVPASLLTRLPPPGRIRVARSSTTVAQGVTFREALRDRRLWLLGLTWALTGIAQMMIMVHIVPYLLDRGVTLGSASLALTIFGISSIAGSLVVGAGADRIGARSAFGGCALLQCVTLAWILVGSSLPVLYVLVFWFGLGASGSNAIFVKTAPEVFGVRAIGAISGALSLGWRIGSALGPSVAGFLYDATGSYVVAFTVAVASLGVGFVSFALSVTSPRQHPA